MSNLLVPKVAKIAPFETRVMGRGGDNTSIMPRARIGPSAGGLCQWILLGLHRLTPLVLPVQVETLTPSPCTGTRHWGLSGPLFGPEDL